MKFKKLPSEARTGVSPEQVEKNWTEKSVDERERELFQYFWMDEQSLTEVADARDVSRQAVSQTIERTDLKTYHDWQYKPKGVYRWSFADDTFVFTEDELGANPLPAAKDIVSVIGPIAAAKILERFESKEVLDKLYGDVDPIWDIGSELCLVDGEVWDRLDKEQRNALGSEEHRTRFWSAVRDVWKDWEQALDIDPLPHWVLCIAMDRLGMSQTEFGEVVGRSPRTLRKLINQDDRQHVCTGHFRVKVCSKLRDLKKSGP